MGNDKEREMETRNFIDSIGDPIKCTCNIQLETGKKRKKKTN